MRQRLAVLAALVLGPAAVAAPALERQPLSRLGRSPFGHGHEVHGLCFTPDGKRLVTSGYDHRARLWDLATGDEVRAFGKADERPNPFSQARWVYSAAVSPDGKTLATGLFAGGWSVGTVTLWDIDKGTEVRTFEAGTAGAITLAFSPDGSEVLAGTGEPAGEVVRYEWGTGREVQRVGLGGGAVRAVGLLAGGKTGAALAGGRVRYWDLGSGKVVAAPAGLPDEAEALALSADGSLLAVGDRAGAVRVFDVAKAKELHKLDGHKKTVRGLAFAADGKHLASADEAGDVRVWETGSGKRVGSAAGPVGSAPWVLGVSSGGKFVAVAAPLEGRARVWEAASGKVAWPGVGHSGGVWAVSVGPSGVTSTAAQDGTLRRWDGGEPMVVKAGTLNRHAVAFAPDGSAAAYGAPDGKVHILDWKTGKETRAFQAHPSAVTGLAFTADGKRLASAAEEKTIRLWDAATGKAAGEIESVGSAVSLRFTRDGSVLAWRYPGTGTVALAGVEKGAKVVALAVPENVSLVESATISPDGQWLAAGTRTGAVVVWGPERNAAPRELRGPRGYVMAMTFSPDGRTLAAGGWGTAHLWEVGTWDLQVRLDAGSGDTLSLDFAPTGRSLAAGGLNGWVGVYDLPGVARGGKAKPRTLARGERDDLWKAVAGDDAAAAYRAVWALSEFPDEALPLLKEALKPVPKGGTTDSAGAVAGRRLGLAEQLRTPAARTLLEELAAGDPEASLTRQAQAALSRLGPK